MGIRGFSSWLVTKYPEIVTFIREWETDDEDIDVEEEDSKDDGDEEDEVDAGEGHTDNDEGEEDGDYHKDNNIEEEEDDIIFDNLYLDMNDIIHGCCFLNNGLIYIWLFSYLDRLLNIVRPRKLLYLALDGVAPLAKMSKLRQGYFKSTQYASAYQEKFRAQGEQAQPFKTSIPVVMMPGTEFMEKISIKLEYYIRSRLETDPRWKDIKVILSDINVPGEGEQKIMSFIRAQRNMENYDPNTHHCLYGHDSDLIILALASHEVHISILQKRPRSTEGSPRRKLPIMHQFLNICVLREYLELEMTIPGCKHDIERLIDDFIFICFLTGNDYIPQIPSLDIREFAIDLLIEVYKTNFSEMGGYIVNIDKIKDKNSVYLEVSRLEKFFHALSLFEDKILLKRYEVREKFLLKLQYQAAENEQNGRNSHNMEQSPDGADSMAKSFLTQGVISTSSSEMSDVVESTLQLHRNVTDFLKNKDDLYNNEACRDDMIRLGTPGWKFRFYRHKFGAETSEDIARLQTEMVQEYLQGLCWMLRCYFSGIPSWTWYYPFYYAPFTSDLNRLPQFKTSFTMGKPLKPFDQLMAVFPPEMHVVSDALPKCYSKLIGCKNSTIQMFYPTELEIDTDGERYLSKCIAKLPFIDEKLLLSATETVEKDLTVDETRRNSVGQERIFVRNSNALAKNAAFVPMSDYPQEKFPISSSEIGGWLSPDDDAPSIRNVLCPSSFYLKRDSLYPALFTGGLGGFTVSAKFFNPDAVKLISGLLDNVIVPDKTVTEADIIKRQLWHTYPGSRPPRVTCKPETLWKASSPTMPREEAKIAGTGWMGRGRGSTVAAAETQRIGSSSYGLGRGYAGAVVDTTQIGRSGYGHGRGNTETLQQRTSSSGGGGGGDWRVSRGVDAAQSQISNCKEGDAHGRGGGGGDWRVSRGVDAAQSQISNCKEGDAHGRGGGAAASQQTRPWARGGGRGGSGQPRAW